MPSAIPSLPRRILQGFSTSHPVVLPILVTVKRPDNCTILHTTSTTKRSLTESVTSSSSSDSACRFPAPRRMKLFYAPQSPFARKVRAAVIELGLGDRIIVRWLVSAEGDGVCRANHSFLKCDPSMRRPAPGNDVQDCHSHSTTGDVLDCVTAFEVARLSCETSVFSGPVASYWSPLVQSVSRLFRNQRIGGHRSFQIFRNARSPSFICLGLPHQADGALKR